MSLPVFRLPSPFYLPSSRSMTQNNWRRDQIAGRTKEAANKIADARHADA